MEERRLDCSLKRDRWWEGGLGIEGAVAVVWGVEVYFGRNFAMGGPGRRFEAHNCSFVDLVAACSGMQSEHCRVAY